MNRLLRYVRRQPRHVRDSFAMYGAVCVTGVIAMLWAVQLPSQLASVSMALPEESAVPAPVQPGQEDSRLPFSGFIEWVQTTLSSNPIRYEAVPLPSGSGQTDTNAPVGHINEGDTLDSGPDVSTPPLFSTTSPTTATEIAQ